MNFERSDHVPAATGRARGLRRRMTWSEKMLWRELRKLNANFRRQAPIGRYFADFAAHGAKLVIEVDGGVHERLDEVVLRDFERQCWLEGEGSAVLRFTDRQVIDDVEACIEAVRLQLGRPPADLNLMDAGAAPGSAILVGALHSPPSPTLPPSRRKGA
ncbi:MAG TPA: endonuclease domain-containing protein [Phenylobacterium sp.]